MKTEASVVNYFLVAIREAYHDADLLYRSSSKYFEKVAHAVYLAFEDRCKTHPKFNTKHAAMALRQLIIDYYQKNQYPMSTAMRTFVKSLPEKFKVRGEYSPLTLA